MKKLFLLMLALPLLMVSCDDDDNLPKVKLNIEVSGGVSSDGYIYVLQGDALSFNSITVDSEESTSGVQISGADYYLDYRPVWSTLVPPYAFTLQTGTLPTGNHIVEIQCPVLAVGYSPAIAYVTYRLKIVDSLDDIPDNAGDPTTAGSFSSEIRKR